MPTIVAKELGQCEGQKCEAMETSVSRAATIVQSKLSALAVAAIAQHSSLARFLQNNQIIRIYA